MVETDVRAVCASCGDPLTGSFCARCGEEVADRRSLSLWHFASHSLLHELTHFDAKIFTTFRYLLFRPGFLSQEYFAERRRKYINPVRLLLTAIVVFALIGPSTYSSMMLGRVRLNLLPPQLPSEAAPIEVTTRRLDILGVLTRQVERAGATKDLTSAAAVEKFHHELKTYGTALSIGNVVLLAGLLFTMFHKRRLFFIEHLVFSLHLAAFVLLTSVLAGWLYRFISLEGRFSDAPTTAVLVVFLVPLIQVVYLHQALLHFYYAERYRAMKWWSGTAWLTKLAVLVVFLGNSLFNTLVYVVGATIALARL